MTTHPILGQVAPIESLGRAVLEAIELSGGCSIPQVLADINARALGLPVQDVRSDLLEAYDFAGDVTASAILAGERRALNREHAEVIRKKAQKAFLWITNVYTALYGAHPGDDLSARTKATGATP